MPNILINEVNLYYEIHGNKGEPLLLIAGLASDSQSWQPVIDRLSQHHLVITFDNRGAGRTTPQNTKISIQQIADDTIALIKHLGYSSVNILGHSMGGMVAMDIAIRYPDYVDKLILVATSSSNSKRNNALFADWVTYLEMEMEPKLWFKNIFFWIFSQEFFENELAVKEAVQYSIDYPYPQLPIAFRNQIKAIKDFDCTKDLSRVTARTMVVSGKEDLLMPEEVCSSLAQAIHKASFSVIPKAAHSIHSDQPQLFTDCVLEFISRAD